LFVLEGFIDIVEFGERVAPDELAPEFVGLGVCVGSITVVRVAPIVFEVSPPF
jgi:hypothetical protein